MNLVVIGALALLFAIIWSLSVLALVGLGLVFWGIILAYVQTDEYTKKILLDETLTYQQLLLQQIINEQDRKGRFFPRFSTN